MLCIAQWLSQECVSPLKDCVDLRRISHMFYRDAYNQNVHLTKPHKPHSQWLPPHIAFEVCIVFLETHCYQLPWERCWVLSCRMHLFTGCLGNGGRWAFFVRSVHNATKQQWYSIRYYHMCARSWTSQLRKGTNSDTLKHNEYVQWSKNQTQNQPAPWDLRSGHPPPTLWGEICFPAP